MPKVSPWKARRIPIWQPAHSKCTMVVVRFRIPCQTRLIPAGTECRRLAVHRNTRGSTGSERLLCAYHYILPAWRLASVGGYNAGLASRACNTGTPADKMHVLARRPSGRGRLRAWPWHPRGARIRHAFARSQLGSWIPGVHTPVWLWRCQRLSSGQVNRLRIWRSKA